MWLTGSRLTEILACQELADVMLEMLRTVEDEPSLLGASSHVITTAVSD